MASLLRIPARLAVLIVRLYQITLGHLIGGRCRFHPSCSQYAVEAIETLGLVRGGSRAVLRLLRCGPWTAGGLDPVRSPAEVSRG